MNTKTFQPTKVDTLNNLLDMYMSSGSRVGYEVVNGKKVEVRFVMVTPELASKLLDNYNTDNRQISKINLNTLINEMLNGDWRLNGETISFDSNGKLTNGQHRLLALSKTESTYRFIVTTGLDEDTFSTIDMGKKRVGGDILHTSGIPNSGIASSVCKFIYNFKNGKFSGCGNSERSLTNTQIFEYYKELDNVARSITFGATSAKKSSGMLSVSMIGGFHYLLSEVNNSLAEDFLNKLIDGVNLVDGSPIIALRNKILKAKMDQTYRLTNETLTKCIAISWEKFCKGEKMTKIRIPDDYVPNIYGLKK